ncbi:SDR family NAD(P)-dependent oxidoreductase [Frateuria aurantia]
MIKTVLVTGATSGIGAASVRRFIAAGWQVIAIGRREDRLQALSQELHTSRLLVLALDVCDGKRVEQTLTGLPEAFTGIDVLVNNAGLALGSGPAQSASLDDWRTMIGTNVTALAEMTHRLLPVLIRRKGVIINMASTAASYPYPGSNVYGGTKSFVSQFSRGLRSDLHGTGVRVSSLEPGMVETEFTLVRNGRDIEAASRLYEGSHPLSADDIAEMVYWTATLPAHININRLELMPTSQSWSGFQVARET